MIVVGGGIAGLAAAYTIGRADPPVPVTIVDGAGRLGGKLATSEVAGRPVDEGADSFLVRTPEAAALARAVGLGDDLVAPAASRAAVWTRGALRPLPTGTVLGVPGDLRALAASRVLSPAGLARVALDLAVPASPQPGDVAVGSYVARRLGREVVDRLVDPLLGGVYAGRADALSLAATAPALRAAAAAGGSLVRAARAATAATAATATADAGRAATADAARAATADSAATADTAADGPVFMSISGGLGRFAAAVADASGARIVLGAPARELRRLPDGGWQVVVGSTRDPRPLCADAVVLAVPAAPAARLLRSVAPAAAADLAGIEYASVALVTLAYPAAEAAAFPTGSSGFLVPAVDGRVVKAVTVVSAKWARLGGPNLLLRASVGRAGDVTDLQRDDPDLVAAVRADLLAACGLAAEPVDTRVSRWGGALPQYAVGHLDRVARIRSAVRALPGLAVCGAAYDGVGIPACVRSGTLAARQVMQV